MGRAISSVIATVIIVAITVALAIGASIWSTSTTSFFSPYESLEIVQVWSDTTPQGDFTLNAKIKNAGMTEFTVDDVLINGKPFASFAGGVQVTVDDGAGARALDPNDPSKQTTLSQQEKALVAVHLPGEAVDHGQTLELQIHTANGKLWHCYATLP